MTVIRFIQVLNPAMISSRDRQIFDEILEQTIGRLPEQLRVLLEEVPLIVEDEPDSDLLSDLVGEGGDLCGLHWGVPLTDRSVETSAHLPDRMMLFRGPILRLSRYPGSGIGLRGNRRGRDNRGLTELRRQIKITLLHEIGHHFGLDEEDLDNLGYG